MTAPDMITLFDSKSNRVRVELRDGHMVLTEKPSTVKVTLDDYDHNTRTQWPPQGSLVHADCDLAHPELAKDRSKPKAKAA